MGQEAEVETNCVSAAKERGGRGEAAEDGAG